jgi:Tol biopolymer transport system component
VKGWKIALMFLLVFGIVMGCVDYRNTDDKGQGPPANLTPGDIVFERWAKLPDGDLTTNIYFINSDGKNEVKLTEGKGPLWSPDGRKILFENNGLYVINADGSGKIKIHDVVVQGAGKKWESIDLYSWTPDGGKILFIKSDTAWREVKREAGITWVTGTPTDFRLYIVDSDGTNLTEIAKIIPHPIEGLFALSPDTSSIAYVVEKVESGETVYYLYIMSVDGSERKILTKQKDEIKALAFSPDGNKLAYVAFIKVPDEFFGEVRTLCLFLIDLEKGSEIKVKEGNIYEFAWSPDSRKIAYSTYYELFVVDLARNTVTKIVDLKEVTGLEWSPDGDKILATVDRHEEGVIYVVNVNDSNVVKLTSGTGARWLRYSDYNFDYKSPKKKEKKDEMDYTDSFTKEVLKNPEPYVGKEVTLTLDKEKYFPDLDVWGQTVEISEGSYYGGNVRVIRYYDSDLLRWNQFKVMNLGPTVEIMNAKAVKLTGILEEKYYRDYWLKAYKVEPIY